MPTATNYRLGRLPARKDSRTLRFARFAADMPAPPEKVAWSTGTAVWPMMLNDRIGDCTIAAAGHLVQEWTANTFGTTGLVIADADIIAAYSGVSGYNPVSGANDNGAVMLDVLGYWQRLGIGGHKIHAYCSLNPKDRTRHKQAIHAFGGSYIGIDLPRGLQPLVDAGQPWDLPPNGKLTGAWAKGSWGGHAVPIVAYDANWATIVTWGKLVGVTWRFLDAYMSEAWAAFSPVHWLRAQTGLSPSGFGHDALDKALTDIGVNPNIGPEPTPVPPTPVPTPPVDLPQLTTSVSVYFGGNLYTGNATLTLSKARTVEVIPRESCH